MEHPEQHIHLRSSARSDRGRVRQNNEDSVHLWERDGYVLAVVADGMGGAVAGEEASRIAVETIDREFANGRFQQPVDDDALLNLKELAPHLGDAVQRANQNIFNKASANPDLKGMGTTVTIAFAHGTNVIFAHVGDSRAYIVDGTDGHIRQVTADHSFVQALLDAGHITEDEAENHPMGNVLYRALGQSDDLDVDLLTDVRLHLHDRLILCSDGLTLHVNKQEIADIATSSSDPNQIADSLVETALGRGGRDNISVIVITVEEVDSGDSELHKLEQLDIDEDDAPTLPMNPDFHNITRVHDRPNWSTDNPSSSLSSQHPEHGEGQDTHEPFQ